MNNPNFLYVAEYDKQLTLEQIYDAIGTEHSKERADRIKLAKNVKNDEVDKTFIVDKGHPAGMELHCVTKEGRIWILNERKYLNGDPCLITVLFGRPNQVKRLYDDIGPYVDKYILDVCYKNYKEGLNNA